MKQTKLIMGMPITLEVCDGHVTKNDLEDVFKLFKSIDHQFSPFRKDSEVMKINSGELTLHTASSDMKEILTIGNHMKIMTDGYFDIYYNGYLEPSGIVKGWAIQKAHQLLRQKGFVNFFVDAGGDVAVSGENSHGSDWRIGIRNPFNRHEVVTIVGVKGQAAATSGTAIRGDHIKTPVNNREYSRRKIVSVTVVAPDILEADCLATAAFAMGERGIHFLEQREGIEAYMIDTNGMVCTTSGFERYAL